MFVVGRSMDPSYYVKRLGGIAATNSHKRKDQCEVERNNEDRRSICAHLPGNHNQITRHRRADEKAGVIAFVIVTRKLTRSVPLCRQGPSTFVGSMCCRQASSSDPFVTNMFDLQQLMEQCKQKVQRKYY
ncbi:hypothetical protein Drorol1_Dr00008992 [Drosera rotundifolia]